MAELAIAEITVEKRHRKDLGNIHELAESIRAVGLLHPIVVTTEHRLVAGERRIAAYRELGRDKIPVTVAKSITELSAAIRAECDENTCRKDFTPLEAVAIGERIEKLFKPNMEKAATEGRKSGGHKAGNGRPSSSGKSFTQPKRDNSKRTSSVAASAVGMSHTTYEKAKAVRDAAKSEPDKHGRLAEEMERTGKVNGAFKKLKVAKQSEQLEAEPPPLPKGPFRVIVVDPPWQYGARSDDPSHRASNPYPSMPIDEIKAMKIAEISHDAAVLWLWTTNAFLRESFEVVDAWGFEFKTMLTWAKDRMGTGDWLRGQTEHCLMCIRGKPTIRLTNQTTLLKGPLRDHSRKPEEFFQMVEELCPGSKVEIFSREKRDGWNVFGDEAN